MLTLFSIDEILLPKYMNRSSNFRGLESVVIYSQMLTHFAFIFRSLLNVRWAGFHDPHSGMQNFVYCIGTALGLCDVLSWQSALDETSTVVTGVNLPSNKLLYVTVKGFNNVGLNITASSSGFLIDDTPPIIQSEPRLLNSDNTEVMTKVMTTADCSLLHVHWSFKDDESPIVEQFIRIHPHTSGMISLKNMLLPPLSRTTIQLKEKEWLQVNSFINTGCLKNVISFEMFRVFQKNE